MRIDIPVVAHKQNRHVYSAPVTGDKRKVVLPGSMWFATSGKDPNFNTELADAFLVGLVAPAMKLGEDIRVEAKVSARLAHGLEIYQAILNEWWPETFKLIDIDYAQLEERSHEPRAGGVACTFSGGLDSFHAVAEWLPSRMKIKSFSITHAMMINGFDQLVDLEHRGLARHMSRLYAPVLADWGVELLMIDTNLGMFRSAAMVRSELVNSYGGFLASCAHALGGVFGRFGISGHGNYSSAELEPYGSHPVLDHQLGTDQLQVIYAGSSRSRTGKLEMVADMPVVQNNLRVCFHPFSFDRQTGRVVNCGECEKCVRTLIALMIIGKLEAFSTFPSVRPVEQYQRPEILAAIHSSFLIDLADLAERYGQETWVNSIRAVLKSKLAKVNEKPV